MQDIKCPECGQELPEEIHVCPYCGYEIQGTPIDSKDIRPTISPRIKYRFVPVTMCILACICFIVAFTRINNDTYVFYQEHYETCMEGYRESIESAENSGTLFRSTYKSIASSYEDMAQDDADKLRNYRVQAITLVVVGVVFISIAFWLFIRRGKETRNGAN